MFINYLYRYDNITCKLKTNQKSERNSHVLFERRIGCISGLQLETLA